MPSKKKPGKKRGEYRKVKDTMNSFRSNSATDNDSNVEPVLNPDSNKKKKKKIITKSLSNRKSKRKNRLPPVYLNQADKIAILEGFSDAVADCASNLLTHDNSSKDQEEKIKHSFVEKKSHLPSADTPTADPTHSQKNTTSILKYIDKDIDDSPFGQYEKMNRSKGVYYGESHLENQDLSPSHLRHNRMGKSNQIFIEEENEILNIDYSDIDKISDQLHIRASDKIIQDVNNISVDQDESSNDNNSSIFVDKNELELLAGKK